MWGSSWSCFQSSECIVKLLIYFSLVQLCIFFIPATGVIPLHNHPEMTVFSKLLLGTMHIKSYDLVDPVNLEGLEPSSQRERLSLSLSLPFEMNTLNCREMWCLTQVGWFCSEIGKVESWQSLWGPLWHFSIISKNGGEHPRIHCHNTVCSPWCDGTSLFQRWWSGLLLL